MLETSPPGPCRYCGAHSWLADGQGSVHACCKAWRKVIAAGYPCPACQVARAIQRQPATWADGSARQVRLPAMLPLPRFLPGGDPFVPEIGGDG